MSDKYILDGKVAVPCNALLAWGAWFETASRHVADTRKDGVRVSTVFLGLDHSFGGSVPLLFETMIFGGEHDQFQERYSTWDEAETGHKDACTMAGIS